MWVIYFLGKPTYWLQCDRLYTIGRKDTDVVILEDGSISRMHMNITVGKVGTIAGLGRHMLTTAGRGHDAHHDMSEEALDDRISSALGSVTSPAELLALYPAAPLIFEDLSKYGSTLEFVLPSTAEDDNDDEGQRSSKPASKSSTPAVRSAVSPSPSSAASATSVSALIGGAAVTIKMRNGAVVSSHPHLCSGGGSIAKEQQSSVSGGARDGLFVLPQGLRACRLRVGTHEAVFEFKWEPLFVLLGQTEGGGNNTGTSAISTHQWTLKAIAQCGYIVLNAKQDVALAARLAREQQEQATDSITAKVEGAVQTGGGGGGPEKEKQNPNTAISIVPHLELPSHVFRMASFLLTAEITPTPLLMASLCAARPIVGLQLLENVLSRVSPKVPLPEPTSTLALPKKIHVFFSQLIGGGQRGGVDEHSLSSSFVARVERSRLFSLTTFVAVQRPVYDELKSYIPLADGHILFDEFLSKACRLLVSAADDITNTTHNNNNNNNNNNGGNGVGGDTPRLLAADGATEGGADAKLKGAMGKDGQTPTSMSSSSSPARILGNLIDAFFARHSHRVLVYLPSKASSAAGAPLSHEATALKTLIAAVGGSSSSSSSTAQRRSAYRMPTVEYTALLSSVVRARKLDIVVHHQSGNAAALLGGAGVGSGILGGFKRPRSTSNSPSRAAVTGRRTENGNIFGEDGDHDEDARDDGFEVDVDATIDPAASGNRTSTQHRMSAAAANNSMLRGGTNRLLASSVVTTSNWKSKDELRAQTSTVLLPLPFSTNGNDLDGDDDDEVAAGKIPAAAARRYGGGLPLVAIDPLSGKSFFDAGNNNEKGGSVGGDVSSKGAAALNELGIRPSGVIEDDSIIVSGPPVLPPYPCFQKWGGDNDTATTAVVVAGVGKKSFKKQFIQVAPAIIPLNEPVELRRAGNPDGATRPNAAGLGLGGLPGVTVVHVNAADDDIIPDDTPRPPPQRLPLPNTTTTPPLGIAQSVATHNFNPYDLVVHNRQQRRAGGVAARREEVGLAPLASATAAGAVRGRGGARGRGGRGGAAATRSAVASPAVRDAAEEDNIGVSRSNASAPNSSGPSANARSQRRGGGLATAVLTTVAGGGLGSDEDPFAAMMAGHGAGRGGGGGGIQPSPMPDTQSAIDNIFDVDNLY